MEVGGKTMKKILYAIFLLTLSFSIMGCSAASDIASSSKALTGGGVTESNQEEVMKSKSLQSEALESGSESYNETAEYDDAANSSTEAYRMYNVNNELNVAVGNAVIDSNAGSFLEGELQAEGHIILQQEEQSDDTEVIYALTMYGEYAFQNDELVKISGTGAIPAVITFSYDKDSGYSLRSYSVPNDGSGYVDSVKEMFPKDLYNYVLSVSDSDMSNLQAQERKYAKSYLNKIGRSAVIGDSADINYDYPDISAEASSDIFKRYWEYPSWIGTEEKIEDGVRYVYETQWKSYSNDDSMIYFTKYVFGTGEIIKTINVFIEDGVVQSSQEKVSRIIENSTASSSASSN